MKATKMDTSYMGILLIAILTLSLLGSNIIIVHAGDVTGKTLEITFNDSTLGVNSGCWVTATKEASEQEFTFYPPDDSYDMAAGTVKLQAYAGSDWLFLRFEGDPSVLSETDGNVAYYDNKRHGGTVNAVFVKNEYTLTVTPDGSGSVTKDPDQTTYQYGDSVILEAFADPGWSFDSWSNDLTGSTNPASITITGNMDVTATFTIQTFTITASAGPNGEISDEGTNTVNWHSTPKFTFTPDTGYHVSAVIVDDSYITLVPTEFTESYTFYPIEEDHTIQVIFALNGEAEVPAGTEVTVFLDSGVSLTFTTVQYSGTAFGTEYFTNDDLELWDLTILGVTYDGQVLVALRYDDDGLTDEEEENLRLYRSDSLYFDEFLKADTNGNGRIDGADVSTVANAVKKAEWYQPELDIDGDGKVDQNDVHIVNELKGLEFPVDITFDVDIINNIIYGYTDHFSLFRCR